MATEGGKNNAAVAVLLVMIIVAGGGAAIFFLTRKEDEGVPQVPVPTGRPDDGRGGEVPVYGGQGKSVLHNLGEQFLGAGGGEAVEVVGQAVAQEGGKLVVQASKDVVRAHNAVTGTAADLIENVTSVPRTFARETGGLIRSGVSGGADFVKSNVGEAAGFVKSSIRDVISVPKKAVSAYTGAAKEVVAVPGAVVKTGAGAVKQVVTAPVSTAKKAGGAIKRGLKRIF